MPKTKIVEIRATHYNRLGKIVVKGVKLIIGDEIRQLIGDKYYLKFESRHRYCITGPYVNEEGDRIPSEFDLEEAPKCKEFQGVRWKLEYMDGCFHPFLVQIIDDTGGN